MNILVCDDDREIARAIGIYLSNEGYTILTAYNGRDALQLLETEDIQLVIMDIMMPGMDGLEATMKIREKKNIPIIMLSAKSEDYDKINGLNVGADDYMTKPFNPMELVARVRSHLRRYIQLGSLKKEEDDEFLQIGGLVMNDRQKTVTVDGQPVALTPKEYGILKLLADHPGQVFSMEQIYENVWNEPAYSPENTVAVHIRHIREKIEIDPKNPDYLKVVWGVGYKLEKPER